MFSLNRLTRNPLSNNASTYERTYLPRSMNPCYRELTIVNAPLFVAPRHADMQTDTHQFSCLLSTQYYSLELFDHHGQPTSNRAFVSTVSRDWNTTGGERDYVSLARADVFVFRHRPVLYLRQEIRFRCLNVLMCLSDGFMLYEISQNISKRCYFASLKK